jgi:hypothetical protein
VLFSGIAFAQTAPNLQVFGGLSYLTFDCGLIGCVGTNHGTLQGWNTQVTGFFNRYVGLDGDVAGYYRSVNVGPPGFNYQDPVSQYTLLFGPTLRVQPRHRGPFLFTHALFGADRSTETPAPRASQRTNTAWALAVGGGFDENFTKRIGMRLGFDWVRTNNYSQPQNQIRFSTGIVLNFPPIGKS